MILDDPRLFEINSDVLRDDLNNLICFFFLGPCGGSRGAWSSGEELSVGWGDTLRTTTRIGKNKHRREGDGKGKEKEDTRRFSSSHFED